jgi:hypothetical protein
MLYHLTCASLCWDIEAWIICTRYSSIPKSLFMVHQTFYCTKCYIQHWNHFMVFPGFQTNTSCVTAMFSGDLPVLLWPQFSLKLSATEPVLTNFSYAWQNHQPKTWLIIEVCKKCLLNDCGRISSNLPLVLQTQSCCHFKCLFRIKIPATENFIRELTFFYTILYKITYRKLCTM